MRAMPKNRDDRPNHSKEAIYLKANKILHSTNKNLIKIRPHGDQWADGGWRTKRQAALS